MVSLAAMENSNPRESRLARRSSAACSRRHDGFTLVELMVVIAIVSAMLGIGVPLFSSFIQDQRLRATSSDLRVGLITARSEAVKRNRVVELQPASGTGGVWGEGWIIPNPDDPDDEDIRLLTHIQSGKVTITGPDEIQFTPMGRVVAAQEFEIQVGTGSSASKSCLQLGTDGRMVADDGACPEEEP